MPYFSDMKLSSYYLYVMLAAMLIMGSCASSKNNSFTSDRPAYTPEGPSSRVAESETSTAGRAAPESRKKKKKGKSRYKSQQDLVKEYEERMEANAKRHKKEAKMAEKPQYSDPSYFGHKKKPKKRPVGKRKFCKECKIVH